MLRLVDLSLESPEENLALDEALLHSAERAWSETPPTAEDGWLRLWESPVHFVVLGVSCRLAADVDTESCHRDRVPILRRASGGGTVLQGPGCLNFALVLPLDARPELRDISRSYVEVVARTGEALGLDGVKLRGSCDLAVGELKFSGNAQKRTRHALLHHGTLLYDFELPLIARYLRPPPKEPDYRVGRSHRDFVRNLPLSRDTIAARIAEGWRAVPIEPGWAPPSLDELIAERYGRDEWTRRF